MILLLELRFHISEFITGLLGLAFIIAALASSIQANKRDAADLVAGLDGEGETLAGTRT
ncbi:DUF475 domain-containing protein [Mycobacterium tuberculosis]|uniref:DUF475 domain-containing protein n=1 Tax=Mycobacterium tuberculosis TaxID=1773 RepID=UPI0034D65612